MLQTADVLRVFDVHRGDAIVVPGRGGRHWGKISTRPGRDLPMGDPAMGGHAGFALGLALALPQNKVVPIGQRSRWQTRTRDKVLADFREEFGLNQPQRTEGGTSR